jgi:hypothetical protein
MVRGLQVLKKIVSAILTRSQSLSSKAAACPKCFKLGQDYMRLIAPLPCFDIARLYCSLELYILRRF